MKTNVNIAALIIVLISISLGITLLRISIFSVNINVGQISFAHPIDNACQKIVKSMEEYSEGVRRIAVLPLLGDAKDNIVTDKLIGAVVKSERYTVVERDIQYLRKLVEELKINRTDMIDRKTAAKVGKNLGAEAVMYGKVRNRKIASLYVRLENVETTEILWAGDVSGLWQLVVGIILFAILMLVLAVLYRPLIFLLHLFRVYVIGCFVPEPNAAKLVVELGKRKVKKFLISDRLTIGRGKKSDVTIGDSTTSISRNHAVIEHRNGTYWLKDEITEAVGKCDTEINGYKLKEGSEIQLKHGDIIQIGSVKCTFQRH